ncbi:unnamed protein product [Owenia fusiformis]|uniref:Uncharacterized protein n=1 Tax=Owenia fusiformis TaxID=6347 RepID=A0A8J1THW8_OWEFU|nr:unnamed protein product [Owenia fusiformis]
MASSRLPTPGKPALWMEEKNKAKNKVSITWSSTLSMKENDVEKYDIMYRVLGDDEWTIKTIDAPDDPTGQVKSWVKLERDTTYVFAVVAKYDDGQTSEMSEISEDYEIDDNEKSENLAPSPIDRASASGKKINTSKNPSVYQLELKSTYVSKDGMIQKYEYGKRSNYRARERVIMIVGASGSGKSTLINVMVNYLLGVERNCEARFLLINEDSAADQSESQTKSIIAYTIHSESGMRVKDTTLTIIDTPGFGDTAGVERDEEITEQIHTFFKATNEARINHIDAVGFVSQSSLPRLTPTQRYIFDKILSIFGKDIKDNIMMLLTFADAREPQVLSGLHKAGITYKKYFKFNNPAIFIEKEVQTDLMEHLFWVMGENSFKQFFEALNTCKPKSLDLTQAVLDLRQKYELNLVQIQNTITLGLNKLEQLNEEMKIVDKHEEAIKENRSFEYTIDEETLVKRPTNNGVLTTYCLNCHITCHDNCTKADGEKINCRAMDSENGKCMTCPGHCSHAMHKHEPFIMVPHRKTVRKTNDHLKARYDDSMKNRLTKIDLMQKLKREFDKERDKTLLLIDQNRQTIEYLDKIALKPKPMSTTDYIDTMIQAETGDRSPGYQKRIEELYTLRRRAEECAKLLQEGHDPFVSHRGILDEFEKKDAEMEAKRKKYSALGAIGSFFGGLKEGFRRAISKKDKKPKN